MNIDIRIQPITIWHGKETVNQKFSRFDTGYKTTKEQLEKELGYLRIVPGSVVIQMWINAHQITLDGTRLRADAKPYKPGVILCFTRITGERKTPNGRENITQDVNFPCDTFPHWQDNFRAIIKSLEALRAVERYGVFKYEDLVHRLGLPDAAGKLTTRQEAAAYIAGWSDGYTAEQIDSDPEIRKAAYRIAARKTHPDTGGSVDQFSRLVDSNNLLEAE